MVTRSTMMASFGIAALLGALGCGSSGKSGGSGGAGGDEPSGGTGGSGLGGTGGAGTGGKGGSGGGGASGGAGGMTTGGAGGSNGGSGDVDAAVGDASSSVDAGSTGGDTAASGGANAKMTFFITSETSKTGNLGGIAMADATCARLAAAAGVTGKTWKAYLSTAAEDARARIGAGPWFNFKGDMIAANLAQLHEEGGMKNGLTQQTNLTDKGLIVSGRTVQLPGQGNQHDTLTGSTRAGMKTANTCGDWASMQGSSQVGHSDRMGTQADPVVAGSWNFAHTGDCANTATGGGAGRFYCFASN
jgi:hypothetical protein